MILFGHFISERIGRFILKTDRARIDACIKFNALDCWRTPPERLAEIIKVKDNSPSSTFSSTVHRLFVVFHHLLWLTPYSFFGDKLGFTNTGKFFVGVVTWLVWISFSNKFFYLVVLCLCSFSSETLIFTFGLEQMRTTKKKIQFIVCPGKICLRSRHVENARK